MSFASLRRVLRSARKGLCSTCSKAKYPQLEAAGAGHVGCLIYTFETLGQLVRDEHEVTAMHVAARKGQISVLIYLIENGLVGDVPIAKNGATPAHDAAGTGHMDCLRYILGNTKAGASDVDMNNATPLHWAVQSGHLKVAQWLVIQAHAPIHGIARNGITAIHLAAAKNYLDILRWLVGFAYKHYPKPRRLMNAKDKNGATPLYHAAHAGHINVIRWIAEKGGGDPTILSNQGLAPLHAATIANHLECVKYLFQFGSATAPGGLRTTEGACALHFAAADGYIEIIKWLLKQKECTGNERDYYQSTPMHDAAEHGRLKVIQALYDHGADINLTDIEGNTPRDLAEKNGHNKCAKYILASMRHNAPQSGVNGSVVNGPKQARNKKHSKAEMLDSYGNAPPHQLPVSVFEEEDDDDMDGMGLNVEGEEQWETLYDLMDESEIEQLEMTSPDSDQSEQLSTTVERRRKFEENIRREVEEKKRKREVMLKREREYEKEIRERLIAEGVEEKLREIGEGDENGFVQKRRGKDWKKRQSDPTGEMSTKQLNRLSLPTGLQDSKTQMAQRGLVEKRTQEFELKTPHGQKGRNIFAKLWPGKRSGTSSTQMTQSPSWDSKAGTKSPQKLGSEADDNLDIPEAPPLPTVEYLLGKRPVNLRKRASQNLREQIEMKVASIGPGVDTHESDESDQSSTPSDHKTHKRKKSSKKKKRKSSKGPMDSEGLTWEYSKLSVPQSSPPRERKRKVTPIPQDAQPRSTDGEILAPRTLYFDSPRSSNSESASSPVHVPLPNSPFSVSPGISSYETRDDLTGYLKPAQPVPSLTPSNMRIEPQKSKTTNTPPKQVASNLTTTSPPKLGMQPKRPAPKLPPHLQNKIVQQANLQQQPQPPKPVRTAPIQKKASSRKSAKPTTTGTAVPGAETKPDKFMDLLNEAIASSPRQPQIVRQLGQIDSGILPPPSPPGTHSPTIDEIELQLDAMKTTLANSSPIPKSLPAPPQRLPPSPTDNEDKSDSDTDSSEYTSSSDDSSSSDSESSSEDEESHNASTPRRPIMARNRAIGFDSPRQRAGFNRGRMYSRYPRLLRKKVMRMAPIDEVPEEVIHAAETPEQQAVLLNQLHLKRNSMKAWRKYIQMMKSAYRKAEKMAQRKRRNLLAKTFYVWIQVRNIGAVEKDDIKRARIYHERKLMKKVVDAWLSLQKVGAKMPIARSSSLVWLTAEDRYISWMNDQLQSCDKHIDDIFDCLADGVLIILAMENASGKKCPKYNPRPKVRLHCQDNWKVAHGFMNSVGVNIKGIEAADLANVAPAAIHNLFNQILKWHEKQTITFL